MVRVHVCVCACMCVHSVTSVVSICEAMDCQAPLDDIFQERTLSVMPCPSPRDLPNLGIEVTSPVSLAGGFFTAEPSGKPINSSKNILK